MANQVQPFNPPVALPALPRSDIASAVMAGCATLVVGWAGAAWTFNKIVLVYTGSDKGLSQLGAHFWCWIKSCAHLATGGLAWPNDVPNYWHYVAGQPDSSYVYGIAGGSLTAAAIAAAYIAWRCAKPVDPSIHVRGRQLREGKDAIKEAGQEARAEGKEAGGRGIELILGSGAFLSCDRETKHINVTGGTGSGKSVALSHILVQAVERGDRVLLIDYKGLTSKTPGNVTIVDPTDSRSVAWAISHDVTTQWLAREAATRMIPETKDPIWSSGSREILTAIMAKLIKENPRKWGFEDLARGIVLPAEEILEICQKYYPQAMRFVDPPDAKSTGDMLKNMNTVAGTIFQLAAAWENRQEFSFSQWIRNPNVKQRTVILKINDLFQSMSAGINQAIISVIVSRLSGLPDVSPDVNPVWLLADEFPRLGKVEGWGQMLTVGRSKGLRLVTVVQSISQVRAVFGEHDADTWSSIVGTQILGRNTGATAEWYCQMVGEREIFTRSRSVTANAGGGYSSSDSYARERLPVLMPAECSTELGKVGNGCRNLLVGFKNVHVLDWRFLTPEDGWQTRREDYVPAAWTLEAEIDVTPTDEGLQIADHAATVSLYVHEAGEFRESSNGAGSSSFEIAETRSELPAGMEFIPDLPTTTPTPDAASRDFENPENPINEAVAEHVVAEVASEVLGADPEIVAAGFELIDAMSGGASSGADAEIPAIRPVEKSKPLTPAQWKKALKTREREA